MGDILTERELEFDFRSAILSCQLDKQGNHKMAHCMKAVDFIVEWPNEFWFVEVKDPSFSGIPNNLKSKQINEFVDKIKNRTLFSHELGPKLKDSFLYLYLGDQLPSKTLKYFVLLTIPLDDSSGFLSFCTDELKRSCCLLGPENSTWHNQYITDVLIFNEHSWNHFLSYCPVKRL
ncbi:MAG: hypothetical protein V2I97_06455 [Desulfococcaceae bacterium]|jgi:hypothetical protein|nr:hypothetical protein [Desulfococcaceae bacterium]